MKEAEHAKEGSSTTFVTTHNTHTGNNSSQIWGWEELFTGHQLHLISVGVVVIFFVFAIIKQRIDTKNHTTDV